VQILLRDQIESYEQLELLLFIRAAGETWWTQETLSARLKMPDSPAQAAQAALDGLEANGFVKAQADGGAKRYSYLRQSDNVEATISRLAAAYREYPIPVIKQMSADAIERLRTAALHRFVEAFVVRKDKNRG